MSLSLLLITALISAGLMRFLVQAIPAHMLWLERNWILQQLGHAIDTQASPLRQWRLFMQWDALCWACISICVLLACYLHQHIRDAYSLLLVLSFIYVLILLAIIDMLQRFLPDLLTQSLLWVGLAVQLITPSQNIGLNAAVLGAIVGYLLLWLPGQVYLLLKKQAGVGHGDMKLMAAIGAWMGWQALIPILLVASLVVLASQLPQLIKSRQNLQLQIPFGPFIVIACLWLLPEYWSIG